MSSFEKGGQVSLVAEKDPLVWPLIRTANVFRDPYPGWGADRVCRGLPDEWFDADQEGRNPVEFLKDLETGERVCLDCPLATECREQALRCRARGLFGAVVTTEGGKAWPVDVWHRMKVGGTARQAEKPREVRTCKLEECDRTFGVSSKKPTQKYCTPACAQAGRKARTTVNLKNQGAKPLALAS